MANKFPLRIRVHSCIGSRRSYLTRARATATMVVSSEGIRFHKSNGMQLGEWPKWSYELIEEASDE